MLEYIYISAFYLCTLNNLLYNLKTLTHSMRISRVGAEGRLLYMARGKVITFANYLPSSPLQIPILCRS